MFTLAFGHRRSLRSGLLLAAGIAVLLAITPAFAATWTWDGGAAGGNQWTNTFNWNPDTAPANNGTADLIFGGTTRVEPDMNTNWNVNSVTFNNTAGSFDLQSLVGATLTIGAGGITRNYDVINLAVSTQQISHKITLSAAQTWYGTAFSELIVDGAINNGGNLLTIDGASVSSVYLQGAISGAGGLTKNGLGDARLVSGPNTYAGTTTVNGGALYLYGASDGVTKIPGALVIGDGVGTAIDYVFSLNISDQIADSATVSVLSTGNWDLGTQSIINETITNLNIVSTGVPEGGSVVTGPGTLTLLGNLTMTGGTLGTNGGGTLKLNGSLTANASAITAVIGSQFYLGNGTRTFTVADGAALNDLDVAGVVSNGGIVKDGPGTLRLGAANTYFGGTTLNAGTLAIGNDSALGAGKLTVNGGTLRADGAARTISNVVVNSSFGVDGSFDLTLNFPLNPAGNITKNGSGTLIFSQAATFDGLTVNTGTARFDAGGTAAGGLTNSGTLLIGTQTLTVNGAGLINQNSLPLAGGTLTGSGPVVNNGLIAGTGTIGGTGGFLNNAQLTVSGGNLTLTNAGANANKGNLDVPVGLQLRLTGGMLANTGTLSLAGSVVTGTATLSNNAGGIVSGRGTISAPFANAGGTLRAVGGTMNVTSAFTNSGVIRLDDGAGLAGGAITNTGRIQGDGTISNALTNSTTGSIRVDVGKTLFFTGAFAANAGEINLQSGTLDFASAITNSATGFIAGRGALYTGGLTNNGQMAFSGGTADIHGDVSLTAGSRVVTSGAGSVTTFFDDVVHNGTEIFTGAGTSSVFFGALTGAGPFTGTGTVYSIGDLRPGNSPATVSFGGSLVLGHSTTLTIELGGTTAGSQYDQVHVAGQLALDGTLKVSLLDFSPSSGQLFDILDSGSLSGTFATLQLPILAGALQWNTSQLATAGILSVGQPGDFNANGVVDAADYVVWRKGVGTIYSQYEYDVWRAYFGQPPGSGSSMGASSGASVAVPEPAVLVLLVLTTAGWCLRRCRTATTPIVRRWRSGPS